MPLWHSMSTCRNHPKCPKVKHLGLVHNYRGYFASCYPLLGRRFLDSLPPIPSTTIWRFSFFLYPCYLYHSPMSSNTTPIPPVLVRHKHAQACCGQSAAHLPGVRGGIYRLGLHIFGDQHRHRIHSRIACACVSTPFGWDWFSIHCSAISARETNSHAVDHVQRDWCLACCRWQRDRFLGRKVRPFGHCSASGGHRVAVDGSDRLVASWRHATRATRICRAIPGICRIGVACRPQESWRVGAG